MMQLLNNIWTALSTENIALVNILLIPSGMIENYVFVNLFSILLNITANWKQKLAYVLGLTFISVFNLNFVSAPYNVFINYFCVLLFIKFIFKLNIFKTFIALVIPSFIFALLNVLLQNPYLTLLNITPESFMNIPIYRITYLIIFYSIALIFCVIFKKFRNLRFTLDIIDNLDRKTLLILFINIVVGFLTLGIQLVITSFYIDIVPIIITLLSFVLLVAFFLLSIYSFTRMIKLATTKKDLESAEEYNKSLEILYDKVKGFKHDFNNIVSTLDGYIENNDMSGLKNYFEEVKKDCKITNNLSILNPRIINNPGIYSLLNNKYFKAINLGIKFDIDFFLDLNDLHINMYKFSRILGILIDNAIEEAQKCDDKIIKISFRKEQKNNRAVIVVENTYSNKNVDINRIFEKGISGKENHSGIGLWEVKNYISKSKNLDLFTTKNDKFFKQEFTVYDF